MKPNRIQIIFTIVAIIGLLFFYLLGSGCYPRGLLSYQTVLEHRVCLQQFVEQHYIISLFCFASLYIIHSACALPATSALIITGGFLFGTIPGSIYSCISGAIGGTAAFFAVQYLFTKYFTTRYHDKIEPFRAALHKHHATYILLMRIVPYIPFCIANILAGLTLLPYPTFLWTLLVGTLPSIVLYSKLGAELSVTHSLEGLTSNKGIITSLTLLAVLSGLVLLLPCRARLRRTSR